MYDGLWVTNSRSSEKFVSITRCPLFRSFIFCGSSWVLRLCSSDLGVYIRTRVSSHALSPLAETSPLVYFGSGRRNLDCYFFLPTNFPNSKTSSSRVQGKPTKPRGLTRDSGGLVKPKVVDETSLRFWTRGPRTESGIEVVDQNPRNRFESRDGTTRVRTGRRLGPVQEVLVQGNSDFTTRRETNISKNKKEP